MILPMPSFPVICANEADSRLRIAVGYFFFAAFFAERTVL